MVWCGGVSIWSSASANSVSMFGVTGAALSRKECGESRLTFAEPGFVPALLMGPPPGERVSLGLSTSQRRSRPDSDLRCQKDCPLGDHFGVHGARTRPRNVRPCGNAAAICGNLAAILLQFCYNFATILRGAPGPAAMLRQSAAICGNLRQILRQFCNNFARHVRPCGNAAEHCGNFAVILRQLCGNFV